MKYIYENIWSPYDMHKITIFKNVSSHIKTYSKLFEIDLKI